MYLSTMPHTSLDAGTWVWSWVISKLPDAWFPLIEEAARKLTMLAVQLLAYVSFYILGAKVRSRALLFLYKLFFQLVYHVFYRNLVRPALPSAKMRTSAKLK